MAAPRPGRPERSARRGGEQAAGGGERHGLGAPTRAELGQDPADVHAGGLLAHVQLRADLPVGSPPRELDVLALVAEGHTNREIGQILYMSEKTASVHVSRILAKLGVRSRVEAAGVAHRVGLGGDRVAP